MKEHDRDVMFSSKSDHWQTPIDFFRRLDSIFHFTLDPCTTPDNPLGTPKFFTEKQNGLVQDWFGETVFINPPFSGIGEWIVKIRNEWVNKGVTSVCLAPSRTDTRWFQDNVIHAEHVLFIRGRLKFGNPFIINDKITSAPFPSCLIIFSHLDRVEQNMLKQLGFLVTVGADYRNL